MSNLSKSKVSKNQLLPMEEDCWTAGWIWGMVDPGAGGSFTGVVVCNTGLFGNDGGATGFGGGPAVDETKVGPAK